MRSAGAPDTDPASAMLALMASLQQPAQAAKATDAASAATQAFDALNGAAGKGKRGDAAQLAALQAAMKSAGKDRRAGSAAQNRQGFATTAALRNPALAAAVAPASARTTSAPPTPARQTGRRPLRAAAGAAEKPPARTQAEPTSQTGRADWPCSRPAKSGRRARPGAGRRPWPRPSRP
jgi:flagellar hook-length control protein FliK